MATPKMFNLFSEFLRYCPPNVFRFDKKHNVLSKAPIRKFKLYLSSYVLFATFIVAIQISFFIKKVIFYDSDSQVALFLGAIYFCMVVIAIICLHCMTINDSFWVAFNTFSNFNKVTKGKQPFISWMRRILALNFKQFALFRENYCRSTSKDFGFRSGFTDNPIRCGSKSISSCIRNGLCKLWPNFCLSLFIF